MVRSFIPEVETGSRTVDDKFIISFVKWPAFNGNITLRLQAPGFRFKSDIVKNTESESVLK